MISPFDMENSTCSYFVSSWHLSQDTSPYKSPVVHHWFILAVLTETSCETMLLAEEIDPGQIDDLVTETAEQGLEREAAEVHASGA
jgi:hypothetical protein